MTRQDKHSELPERKETVRRKILSLLADRPLTAREISAHVGISEKEVSAHLPHIQKTVGPLGRRLAVTPAECRQCGFVFRKRERPTKPGRCPICKGESISEPLFSFV
jgi:predicted Zn-ribbon and HTH transcriptional regulator